jgi:hypothetical protein
MTFSLKRISGAKGNLFFGCLLSDAHTLTRAGSLPDPHYLEEEAEFLHELGK